MSYLPMGDDRTVRNLRGHACACMQSSYGLAIASRRKSPHVAVERFPWGCSFYAQVLNLICTACGKPCRTQTECDLHTKRTGHADFVDKVPLAPPRGCDSLSVSASVCTIRELL